MAGINPFELAKNCFEKHTPPSSDSDCSVNYMLANALSMTDAGLFPAIFGNQLYKCQKQIQYAIMYYLCPRMSRAPFGKYIKKPANTDTDKYKAVIKLMADHYKCSLRHAEQIFELLTKQGNDMYAVYGTMLKTKGKK